MKKTNVFIISLGLVILVIAAGCVRQANSTGTTTESGKGRTVFTMTDAAANMESVTSVKMTVDSVKVHSAAEGWTTVSSSAKTYDLLQLKAEGSQALLADVELEEGTYNQIRLDVSKVVVTDANGQQEAKLPSNELKIEGNLIVEADSTSSATFDFIADESLHMTGEGKYIMAPVLKVETRTDAEVEIKSNNRVEIEGGSVKTNVKVGMDINGNVGVGLKVPSTANISIDSFGKIKLAEKATASGTGRAVFGITDAAANMSSVSSVKITVDSVKVQSSTEGWVTVSSTQKTYDLLKLQGENKNELLADVQLKEGTYNQIRLEVSKVVVTDANGTHEAKLPSGELKMNGQLVIKADSTATALFDFIVNESLHTTGQGKYIMAPVLQLETREDADVEVKSNNRLEISGGKIKTNAKVGMDINGNVGIGLKVSSSAKLE